MAISLTTGTASSAAAWGLGIGTAFYTYASLWDERDFFLVMGNIACLSGNVAFAIFLWNQDETGEGGANETLVTLYLVLAAASCYALLYQLNLYRLRGLFDEDGADEGGEAEDDGGARPAQAAPKRAPPVVDVSDPASAAGIVRPLAPAGLNRRQR